MTAYVTDLVWLLASFAVFNTVFDWAEQRFLGVRTPWAQSFLECCAGGGIILTIITAAQRHEAESAAAATAALIGMTGKWWRRNKGRVARAIGCKSRAILDRLRITQPVPEGAR